MNSDEQFKNEIRSKYNYENVELTREEIFEICNKAVNCRIIGVDDVDYVNSSKVEDVLSDIFKLKSRFLMRSFNLNDFEDKLNTGNDYMNNKKSIFYTPNKTIENSFTSNYHSPLHEPYIHKHTPEDPFNAKNQKSFEAVEPLEFDSMCEELKEKTKIINNKINDKSKDMIMQSISAFIEYNRRLHNNITPSGISKKNYVIAFILFVIVFYFSYTSQPI